MESRPRISPERVRSSIGLAEPVSPNRWPDRSLRVDRRQLGRQLSDIVTSKAVVSGGGGRLHHALSSNIEPVAA
jgi:hypothetical protein